MSDKPVIQLVPKPRLPNKPRSPSPAPLSPSISKRGMAYLGDRLGWHLRWLAKVKKAHPEWPRVAEEADVLRDLIRRQYRRKWPRTSIPPDSFIDRWAWNATLGRPWYA